MKIRNIFAALAIAAALGLPLSGAAVAGMMEDSIDGLYDLVDRYNDNIIKSNRGVREAMRDGPPRQGAPTESTKDYFTRNYRRYQRLQQLNATLLGQQQGLLNNYSKLLRKLPKGDPRIGQVQAQMIVLSTQMSGTRRDANKYDQKRKDFKTGLEKLDPTFAAKERAKRRAEQEEKKLAEKKAKEAEKKEAEKKHADKIKPKKKVVRKTPRKKAPKQKWTKEQKDVISQQVANDLINLGLSIYSNSSSKPKKRKKKTTKMKKKNGCDC